jgi:predicted aspartyl protease
MSYKVRLIREEQHRLKFYSSIYCNDTSDMDRITVMLDTGCYNSLIPLMRANISGIPVNMKRPIAIGSSVVETEAYIINMLKIGELEIKSVFMLAAPFKSELADTILLGLNVLNNLKYTIHKKDDIIELEESYPAVIPNKTNPYRNYFDKNGKYVLLQNNT